MIFCPKNKFTKNRRFLNLPSLKLDEFNTEISNDFRRVTSQDIPFLYTPYHLSELKTFKSIISTNISGIFIFK